MAVTGSIFKSLRFDNEDSRDYGVYITGSATYNAPARDVQMITIPARNGAFALDNGRFENIEVSYPAGIFADTETDFAQAISDFRNALCSKVGYFRLEDDYNPDEYRMAIYKSGLEVNADNLKSGEFTITFECKPQRWLTSGEEEITVGEIEHPAIIAEGDPVMIDNAGDHYLIESLIVEYGPTQDLNGYDSAWYGGAGKNKFDPNSTGNEWVTVGGEIKTESTAKSIRYPATAGQTFTLSNANASSSSNILFLVFFSQNETMLLRKAITNGDKYATATAPANTSFVLASFFNWSLSSEQQLEINAAPTEYAPYANICPVVSYSQFTTYVSPTASQEDARTYTSFTGGGKCAGTYDIVTGEATDYMLQFSGTSRWSFVGQTSEGGLHYAEWHSDAIKPNGRCLCNMLPVDNENAWQSTTPVMQVDPNEGCVRIFGTFSGWWDFDNQFSDIQGCYELATPQEHQFSTKTIPLLDGQTYIWNNGGPVTVTYKNSPNTVVNPTRFESGPLLEVKGYGTIGFNGSEIELDNGDIGYIVLAENSRFYYSGVWVDRSLVGDNDDIVITNAEVGMYVIVVSSAPELTSITLTNVPSPFTATTHIHYGNKGASITFTASTITMKKNQWIENEITIQFAFVGGATETKTFKLYRGWLNDKAEQNFRMYCGSTARDGYARASGDVAQFERMDCQSSLTWLGDPTYIDCELGEAYKIEDGSVASLNRFIDLGSELPTLAVGDTTFAVDDTVTELKVVPRWWKV